MTKWNWAVMAGTVLTGFIGTILGAGVTFLIGWLKERSKKRDEQHGAILRTQLALIGQLNTVRNLQQQFLERFRPEPNRERLLILFTMEKENLRVAFDSIAFLLGTSDRQLLLEIHAAEQSYITAMNALTERNEAYERLHENSELEEYDHHTGRCEVIVKDPRHIKFLKDTTDALYVFTDLAAERLESQIKELFRAGKSLFPKREFLKADTKPAALAGEARPSVRPVEASTTLPEKKTTKTTVAN